jgi:hypothetical protein
VFTVANGAGPDELPPPMQFKVPQSNANLVRGEDRFQTVNNIYRFLGKPEDKRWGWALDVNHSIEYTAHPNFEIG